MQPSQRLRSNALTLFAANGFQATGIRELAAASGISVATLYHYMSTKEDLLRELMTESLERLFAEATLVARQDGDALDRLAGLTIMHVYAHALRPERTVVVDTEIRSLGAEPRASVVALRDAYESIWAGQIRESVDGQLTTVDNEIIARLAIIEMCSAVSYWYTKTGSEPLEDIAAIHANLVLAMLNANRGGKPVRLTDCALPPMTWFHDIVMKEDPPTFT